MTTARDIIRSAIEELGEYAPGETMTDADAERGLSVLNDMLSMWSNENLACFATRSQTFPTVGNQAAYSIGPTGANITSPRPLKIEQAWHVNTDGTHDPITINDRNQWYSLRDVTVTADSPTRLFYDPQAPNGIINLWPKPTGVVTIGIISYLQFTRFANLSDVVQLPNGYEGALKKNLAIELAPFFNRNPLPITVELASQYKGRLKVTNDSISTSMIDPAVIGVGGFNILTDSPR